MIKEVKSPNFDTNLNGKRQNKELERNIYQISEDIKTKSRKYTPIVTRATYSSLRTKKTSKTSFMHSTINWVGSYGNRYNYKDSKNPKNKNKYKWFSRAFNDNKEKYKREITRNVYK